MFKRICISAFLFSSLLLFSQTKTIKNDNSSSPDDALLNQYIHSKGANTIIFDATNIKQYWIDKSVASKTDSIEILLDSQKHRSIPLNIQLANVNETQKCTIEIIANTSDFYFSVLDPKDKVIATSTEVDGFLHFSKCISNLNLEDTQSLSFKLAFHSNSSIVSIKNIILSFSDNKESSFVSCPANLTITKNITNIVSDSSSNVSEASFSVTGKRSIVYSAYKFLVNNCEIENSATITNIGNEPTQLYFGYAVYSTKHSFLDGKNYPYGKTDKMLSIVSSEVGSNIVVVDSYPEKWTQHCSLALNAEEDMSDIPNYSFADGLIMDIQKKDDQHTEITLDKPLKSLLKPGTAVRVHGMSGAFLYTNTKRLQPGEKAVFSSKMKKDDSFFQYSSKAFPKGTYYVIPLILSYSVNSNEQNIVLISDFSINSH